MIGLQILTTGGNGPLAQLVTGIMGVISFFVESFYTTLFNISPLYTEGVWPLGRPISPSIVGPDIVFKGGAVAFFANQAYDKVSATSGGELLIFSLVLFFILYVVGGYAQFFDWTIKDPQRTRDPVIGVLLMLLWFPIYYGFVSAVHALMLMIPIDRTGLAFAITSMASSGLLMPVLGKLALIISAVGVFVIVFIMAIRPLVIGVYLLFGPPLIAIGWADIPKASTVAVDFLKKSIPTAIVPLPLYLMMYLYSFVLSGQTFL